MAREASPRSWKTSGFQKPFKPWTAGPVMADQETEAPGRTGPTGQDRGRPGLLFPWPVSTGTAGRHRCPLSYGAEIWPPGPWSQNGLRDVPWDTPGSRMLGSGQLQGQEPVRLFVGLVMLALWASLSPPGGQVLTGQPPPPFPAWELDSTVETVECGTLPRGLEDLGRGHLWGWGLRHVPQQLGADVGPAPPALGAGGHAGMCWAAAAPSIITPGGAELGTPRHKPAQAGPSQKSGLRPGSPARDLAGLLPGHPAPVLPQLSPAGPQREGILPTTPGLCDL